MKRSLVVKTTFTVIVAFLVGWIVGCASTPKVDWNTRVGNYTYDQAVVELGPPDKQAKLSDNTIVAEWVKRTSGSGFSIGIGGGGLVGSHTALGGGVSQGVGSYHDKVLKLVFAPDGRLASWSKNY
ncbi:MAG TPA: hypothetical protein VN625_01425 [Desulfuromonadaceae bacterium]|nr:hypothetical protein [Desulfuromonadaceae bacterium]